MGNADAPLGEQGGREDVVVVAARAVGCRSTGSLKATAARGAAQERAEDRRLVGVDQLMAEAAAQVVLLGNGVVRLDVVAPHVLVEGQVGREVVRRGSGNVLGGSEVGGVASEPIQLLEHRDGYRADARVRERNDVAGKGRTALAAVCRGGSTLTVDDVSGVGVIDLAAVAGEVQVVTLDVVEGDVSGEGGLFVVGDAKEVTEEEELVLEDRAADGSAGVVVHESSVGAGSEVIARVDAVVLHVLENRTVEAIGSGLQREIDDRTDGAAKFGLEVVRSDVDVRDGSGR